MKSPVGSARRKSLSYIFFAFLAVTFLFFRPAGLSSNDISPLDDEFFEKASIAYKNGEFMLAFDIFSGLAERGIHDAQYNLAVILKSGKGVPKDYIQALFWSWRARLGGIELAVDQSEELMDLVPEKSLKDLRETVRETLRSRVFDGDSTAISRLANYFLIIPDEPNYEKAYLWFLVSAALMQEGSAIGRDEVEQELESEKVVKIQKEAIDLFQRLPQKITNKIETEED